MLCTGVPAEQVQGVLWELVSFWETKERHPASTPTGSAWGEAGGWPLWERSPRVPEGSLAGRRRSCSHPFRRWTALLGGQSQGTPGPGLAAATDQLHVHLQMGGAGGLLCCPPRPGASLLKGE